MSGSSDQQFELNGYSAIEPIYFGSKTLVYQAIRNSDRASVILKRLRDETPTVEEQMQFRNQYVMTKDLAIPGIVRVIGLESCDNGEILVMEDFGGISLSEYRRKHQWSIAQFLSIAVQLSETLYQLHQAQIIHKDIKPANILIHPDSMQVRLIDFSIASQLSNQTQALQYPNQLEGTLAYLSPEQTGRMNRSIDYRSDFYSLGVTFYELLTGRVPFIGEDALEIVHGHLAKSPTPIRSLNPEVPEAIEQIIQKLMAKNAEDRYQSAKGLQADLEQGLAQWKATGTIAGFEIGQLDRMAQFNIPEKLYGREAQIQVLLDAFERARQGSGELVVVSGDSGIGKTALIRELFKPITESNAHFVCGKFDQFKRNIPYACLTEAYRGLIQQILAGTAEKIEYWRDRFQTVLGSSAQVVIDVIPELERLLGQQAPAPELPLLEAQDRFDQAMFAFMMATSSPEYPEVEWMDDLQWADLASITSLKTFLQSPENQYRLIVVAYRENEVDPTHPLAQMLSQMRTEGVAFEQITLAPLALHDVIQFLADTMHCHFSRVQPLAKLLYDKTQGSPFLLTEWLKSLHSEGLVTFDLETNSWQWSLKSIQQWNIDDAKLNQVRAQQPSPILSTSSTTTRSSTSTSAELLDLATIIKATEAISSELVLDQLLDRLLHIVLENAGAQKGCIVLDRAGELFIEVADTNQDASEVVVEAIPLAQSRDVPLSILNYVARTQQAIVSVDAAIESICASDPYILEHCPKSLLCTPILYQGKFIGLVYLENNLVKGAFSIARLEIVRILTGQAAIAIENARLFTCIQDKAAQLERSESRLNQLFEQSTDAILIFDPDEIIFTDCNQSAVNLLGYSSKDDIIGVSPIALSPEFQPSGKTSIQEATEAIEMSFEKGSHRFEWVHCHRTGEPVWLEIVLTVMTFENKTVFQCIWRDITDRKRAEAALKDSQAQLIQSEKMSALGNLVAGVAHEINNPIGFLNGSINNAKDFVQDLLEHLELYEQQLPNDETMQDHAEQIDLEFVKSDLPKLLNSMKTAVDRIKSISRSLRTFSRSDTEHAIVTNIHEGIDSTILILKYRLKASGHRPEIEVITNYGAIPEIECFPGQLNQVFMNILANAIDMFDELQDCQPQIITIQTAQVDQNTVEIRIRDNGKGMPDEVRAKVFEHLFTTKAVGKGTGLGLSIARQIVVEKHQGSIAVNSTIGEGSEFVISLPINQTLS
ncbi:serine/threonine protein kinase and signal transduction histidine kinase with GAF sensor [Leptolyngbya sp. NIES-3755]|nr:serine/threonine protein kinase and signal transduction histidine kinase with GAF sensor [Leptolyngbya sp. NIES-3755]